MITVETIRQSLQCENPSCACHKPGGLVHCPAHADSTPSLSVTEKDGKILVKDFGGCSQDRLISVLKEKGLWPSKKRGGFSSNKARGLTLQELADAKCLPVESLKKWGVASINYKGRPAVYIPYSDLEGRITDRFRLNLKKEPRLIWRKGSKTMLYGLWRLPEFQQAGWVLLVEGETDCWTLWEYGIPALGLPGKTNWKPEWAKHLKGLKVFLWVEPGAEELPGRIARNFPDLLAIKAPAAFKDISEAHIAGEDVVALIEKLKSEAKPPEVPPTISTMKETGGEEPTQQEILLTIAAAAELFHTPDYESFARIPVNGHLENWAIRGGGFKKWLLHGFYKLQGKAPQSEIFSSTIKLLEAKAMFEGPLHPVWVRIAEDGDAIYLDLGNEAWEAVKITKTGWEVVSDPPVCFRRPKSMLPLPYPERGGNINELRPFVNVDTVEDFRLVVAYQLAAMRARGPYPIMVINGEQGSAKSTMARVNRSLVDPNTSPLRSAPREERDLMISATNSWTLAFDNLSRMPPWLSDSFCRLSTGGGISNRELYTNGEEFILDAMRPVILNGIDSLTERPDLADRVLIFNLPQIPDDARRSEKQFWTDFERARPRILGALLDAVSMGLRNQSSVKLSTLPRMADFALWVVACEPALPCPPGSFIAAYLENRAEATELSLEADCVAVAVREYMADQPTWTGKPSELYKELEKRVPDATKKSKVWPKAANKLSGRLKRAATFLRAIGIDVELGGWSKTKGRKIVIRRVTEIRETNVGTGGTVESEESCGFSSHDTKNGTVGTDGPTVGTQEPRERASHGTDGSSHDTEKEPWDGKGNDHAGFRDTHDSHDTLHNLEGDKDILEVEL